MFCVMVCICIKRSVVLEMDSNANKKARGNGGYLRHAVGPRRKLTLIEMVDLLVEVEVLIRPHDATGDRVIV